jgi:hypothetical protein
MDYFKQNQTILISNFFFRIIGADCQTRKGRWHKESAYLRCLQGFFQSAPQLILQSVILTKGILIHSLRELIDNVHIYLASPVQDQAFSTLLEVTFSEKPLKWFWGLIQVYSIVASFISLIQVHVSCNPQTRSNWPKFLKSSLAEL